MSAAEATAQSLIDVWAGEVRRLVPEVRALHQQYDLDLQRVKDDVRRLNEGQGGDWSLGEHYTYATWRRFWAAQHHLVWAAHQLERWVRRLARERGTLEPEPDPLLAALRNALEHLDEAELDGYLLASAGNDPRRNRSLRSLPDARLPIGMTTDPRQLFDLLDTDEVERRALGVVTTADRLAAEVQAWAQERRSRGEMSPVADD
ncbi:protein of unknown function [Modestobacter italicus]|uniref:Uncharacterized protein n=1 Tax=Modestobacter italicus (strain DSM 44449 / CECT 9708 / BC 501) TaxID=2732864 RepID=I4EQZ0_MODI5|nr:hypothetical protein [Modestobacter marinus]CCH85803.1 protein of unknown function [Modestobacter marinus]